MANEYPHDGIIRWDDPFWQSLERELTNEDELRMQYTAAEVENIMGEVEKQDAFAAAGMHDASPEAQEAWMVAHGYAQPGDILGYIPEPSEVYYPDPLQDPAWLAGVEQAEEGNYLEPI